ncbi:bHLH149 protein [Hibiscus syriacus]|uniref:BHLH149 protein n=1 Tax=Hibiscus syriacus TaxID=106335 RepID=A0A6A3B652_HIBSY|nr:transcription factor bHLH149-like [Hibiscus syriacus]KAE8710529.1 bHLH149 protein [Hibiscus syriacus]
MASFLPLPELDPSPEISPDFQRKKRRKIEGKPSSYHRMQGNQRMNRWRTGREQQIYSSKLIEALRRRSTRTSSSVNGKDVRDTAYRVLAVSAKGTTRWSRAILIGRLSAKVRKHKKAKVSANRKLRKPASNKERRKLPVVERKLLVLGRLVPGCRRLSFSNLLEETSDYIAALEMQVRAMTAITEFLAVGNDGGAQPSADRLGSNVNS